ncbi:SIS domain-containing protein [Pseudolysobacter antarcticus]|uniref:SIS domain-containing protein n=1 Tax=Pseudolysobacter antarcticus TaxID=2511995 RepID=A0A411HNQ8_9GAMM|nr:SIS domain-containing protein [Pseudolysobacter antarcticus]QBB72117.1 SIS domain-containing protein [Pseudolysobacter antarcticus]
MSASHDALAGLYPHLARGTSRADTNRLDTTLLDSIRHKAHESIEVKQKFFDAHAADVLQAAHLLADSYRSGGRLYTLGNGGSSCDAAHIAVEFSHPVTAGRPALSAQNLAQDMAMITAVGNDVGIDHVFERQVLGLVRKGDCVIGVSTSGNSKNVLRGLEAAQRLGARTLALAGGDGGAMAHAVYIDLCLTVGSDSIHRVQETHVAIYHILWDLTHSLLADDRAPRGEQP